MLGLEFYCFLVVKLINGDKINFTIGGCTLGFGGYNNLLNLRLNNLFGLLHYGSINRDSLGGRREHATFCLKHVFLGSNGGYRSLSIYCGRSVRLKLGFSRLAYGSRGVICYILISSLSCRLYGCFVYNCKFNALGLLFSGIAINCSGLGAYFRLCLCGRVGRNTLKLTVKLVVAVCRYLGICFKIVCASDISGSCR